MVSDHLLMLQMTWSQKWQSRNSRPKNGNKIFQFTEVPINISGQAHGKEVVQSQRDGNQDFLGHNCDNQDVVGHL